MPTGTRTAFREWFDQIEGRLDAGGDSAQRAALHDEVVALFRAVERELRELAELKEQIRRLVEKWRTFGTRGAHGGAGGPSRSDLIGATTFIEKGWAKISVGDYEAAEAALAKALEMSPADADAVVLLGWAQMHLGKLDEALPRIEQLLARQPSHAIARTNLGFIRYRQGRVGEAIGQLWRAICLDNDRKATLYANFYLGRIYFERAMYADAEAHFRRCIELGPNLIEAYFQLGHALWAAGTPDAAIQAWRDGAAANKFNPWGKRCAEVIAVVESGGAPVLAA